MAIASTCPTCQRSDVEYRLGRERGHHGLCRDPWHADDHLRHKAEIEQLGRPRERAIDKDALRQAADFHNATTIRMRAETSRRHFEGALAAFVDRYAPIDDPEERDRFQRDLMMLMRDAMQHQGHVYGMHAERTEATLYNLVNASTAPLQAIFNPPKKDGQ